MADAVTGVALPADDPGIELRVEFRRESTDTERLQQAWKFFLQDRMQKEIAEELGCSRSNVTRLLRKAAELHGVPFQDVRKRRGTLPRKQEQTPAYVELGDRAVALWNLGKSYREIGRECGCSDTTAEKAIRHWHVSRALPVPTTETRREEQCAVAERLHEEGLSSDEIARQLKSRQRRFVAGGSNLQRSDAHIQRSRSLSPEKHAPPDSGGAMPFSLAIQHTNRRAHFEDLRSFTVLIRILEALSPRHRRLGLT